MQSYPLNLAAGAAQTYTTAARRFVYESGKTVPEGADARIIVKPDNGNEITLRPGQSVGLDPGVVAATWFVRGLDASQPIVGTIIIGSGEFEDSSLKFDSTSGAINVVPAVPFQIGNTAANRVPVALDPATEKALKENPVMSYTTSRNVNSAGSAYVPVQVLAPAENVRGVIVEDCMAMNDVSNSIYCRLVAKAGSAPIAANPAAATGPADGDILIPYIKMPMAAINAPVRRIAVPPGYGLWLWPESNSAVRVATLLTIL